MARRTVLFSPGDQPKLLEKAPESGADVVVFDLEDAVAPGKKDEARETVSAVIATLDTDCELCVRINPLDAGGREDLSVLLENTAAFDSLMLPKVGNSADIAELRDELAEFGETVPVFALLESAGGILDAPAIASDPVVDALVFGAEDLAADIGATRTEAGEEVSYARQRVVLAASNAGVDAIDTLVTDYQADKRLEADTQRSIQFGFDGKLAIHPAQVEIINEGFTPSSEELDWAQRVLDAREKAEREQKGVFSVDGEMIDAPLVAQAERIVERAAAADRSL